MGVFILCVRLCTAGLVQLVVVAMIYRVFHSDRMQIVRAEDGHLLPVLVQKRRFSLFYRCACFQGEVFPELSEARSNGLPVLAKVASVHGMA